MINDGFAVTVGHCLIIPKRHIANYFALGQAEINACSHLLDKQKEKILKEDSSVSGFNVGVNGSRPLNLAIPDGDGAGIWTEISVPDSFVISDVSVTLDIEHTWIGDLGVALMDPGGDFIWLICDQTGQNANELAAGQGYTFTDNAAGFLPMGIFPDYITIPGDSYLPDDTKEDPITTFFSAFAGDNSQGDWRLYLVDVFPGDEGKLISWELDLTPVPIPGAIWLLGSGLAGLVGLRRKFRN